MGAELYIYLTILTSVVTGPGRRVVTYNHSFKLNTWRIDANWCVLFCINTVILVILSRVETMWRMSLQIKYRIIKVYYVKWPCIPDTEILDRENSIFQKYKYKNSYMNE